MKKQSKRTPIERWLSTDSKKLKAEPPIKFLIVEGVPTRKFTLEFETSGETFEAWKHFDETDSEAVHRWLKIGLSEQGLRMSE